MSAAEKCLEDGFDPWALHDCALSAILPSNAKLITQTAKHFHIPRDVLKRRMTTELDYDSRTGRSSALSSNVEKELEKHLSSCAARCIPFNWNEVKTPAQSLARDLYHNDDFCASDAWLAQFKVTLSDHTKGSNHDDAGTHSSRGYERRECLLLL